MVLDISRYGSRRKKIISRDYVTKPPWFFTSKSTRKIPLSNNGKVSRFAYFIIPGYHVLHTRNVSEFSFSWNTDNRATADEKIALFSCVESIRINLVGLMNQLLHFVTGYGSYWLMSKIDSMYIYIYVKGKLYRNWYSELSH